MARKLKPAPKVPVMPIVSAPPVPPAEAQIGVHARVTLDEAGDVDVERVAFCPSKHRTVGLAVCETCTRFSRMEHDGDGPVVVCTPELSDSDRDRERLRMRFDLSELALRVRVGEVMTRVVTCVTPTTAVEAVRAMLVESGATCAPVVSADGALLGIITPSELLPAARAGATAGDVMSRATLGIPEDAPLAHAMATMAQAAVLALPVLAGDGAVVGTIGSIEALRFFARRWGYEIPARDAIERDPQPLG
ncbi:MAG: CBS domain-containing protein [Polyangiaceae bacterium]